MSLCHLISVSVCNTYYEPAGCHADRSQEPRPIPDFVMTERSYSSEKWNGHLIDWGKWDTYSPEMICRCAEKARKLGRKTFGVQFYGKCRILFNFSKKRRERLLEK